MTHGVEVLGLFVRNAVKAVNFRKKCGNCGECGENKYFTAFHRISYKNSPQNSPHRLLWQNNVRNSVNAVGRNNSPHFTAFLTKIHREISRISYKNSPHMISKVYSI